MVFFLSVLGVCARRLFFLKTILVAKEGSFNMDAVRDVMGVWCFREGDASWEWSARFLRKNVKNGVLCFFGGISCVLNSGQRR